jgi:hypothetical protein
LMSFLMFFRQKFSHGATLQTPPPHFNPVLLLLQTTRVLEKSCQAVVCSALWRQSKFLSVSAPRPLGVWGEAGSQSGPLSLSF